MSDELTFLRWVYRNQGRFIVTNDVRLGRVDHVAMRAAYVAETGNKVPNDYRGED